MARDWISQVVSSLGNMQHEDFITAVMSIEKVK